MPDYDSETIFVLSTPSCQKCKFVSRYLDGKGVDHIYVDVQEDAYWLDKLKEWGYDSVPVTLKGEVRIHGADVAKLDTLF